MSETVFLPFTDIFDDVTKYGTKIPTTQYLEKGKYPIIDQGQAYIAGYTNQEKGLFHDVPAIVFGDHTRTLKYVDMPFFLGADGVKILKPKIDCNVKYLYYVMQKQHIPNTGYNRHFKWLKLLILPILDSTQQDKVVCTLEKIERLIAKRKQQLEKMDFLVKVKFYEMFGDPRRNEKGYPTLTVGEVVDFQGGSQPDKSFFEYEKTDKNVRLIQIRDYKTDKYVTYIPKSMAKRYCYADDIMIGRYGPPIFQILQGIEGAFNVALMKATPKMGNKEFVRYFLKQDCLLYYLEGLSKRTAGQDGIQMDKLKQYPLPYPPIELQNEFAHFVEQTEKIKTKINRSLEKLELLKQSLLQKYFG